ncbi:MAG: family 16 glycoside hydrolase [Verrucomicrobiota bacterium]
MNRKPVLSLLAGLALTSGCGAAQPAFFAMDTGTRDATHQTADSQVALVRELGFDGIGPCYSKPQALHEMLEAVDRQHSKLFALYVGLDLDAATPLSPAIRDSIDQLRGRDAVIWLYVTSRANKPSDPAGDARAVPILREVADLAEPAGLKIALYPHATMWVERVDDAVRLARQVDKKNFGATFNLCHWLMVDGKDLDVRLKEALPYLFVVTLSGADTGGKDWGKLIQPLDSGSFDVSQALTTLKQLGYAGPVGLQHFGIPGDVRANLQRSMNAWQRIQGAALVPPGTALAAWEAATGWSEVGNVSLDPQNPGHLKGEPGTGVLVSQGAGQYLLTKERFGDVEVHLEFMIPQHSNSGVYFLGSHEVQVYDSFGVAKDQYPGIECGGIYPEWVNNANVRGHSPRVNASKPPGEWQTLDVTYRAPRFDAAGNKTRNARFDKVIHNGQLVQENVELLGPTHVGLAEQARGPLRLQGDHGPVAYRNLRVRQLGE